jgi:crotonobetainyl-CoA:carnitine CoA-transferase CaiB-like acyl-CoA transferase
MGGEDPQQPLRGIRVLDVATLMAAPWAAAYLSEFGADVIKIEQPGIGDHQRRWGSRKRGQPLMWKSLARNKRSLTLDLRRPRGAEIFRGLVRTADVLIENFRPGTLERWGLAPDSLLELNPRLVVLRVTGFGQTGPYSARPGFGTLAEAFSGFSHLVGEEDGPPTLPNLPLADGLAGVTGAYAVMVALYGRDRPGGCGQVIDLSLYEPLLRLLEASTLDWDQLGMAGMRTGNRSAHVAPRNAYRCADGSWVALSASAQSIFERLARAIGRPELVTDPRYVDNEARVRHADELDAEVASWMARHPRAEVLRVMEEAEVAVGTVSDVPALFSDPHLEARQSLVSVEDPVLGPMRLVNVVPRFSRTPGRVRSTGPELGEHTDEVLRELGIGDEEIAGLREEKVV